MTDIVISDVDDTLLRNGIYPIASNVAKVNEHKLPIYIVTGRPESQRAATTKALRFAGVRVKGMLMSPGDGKDKAQNEASKIQHAKLLGRKFNVVTVYDNDAGTLAQYAKLGLHTTQV